MEVVIEGLPPTIEKTIRQFQAGNNWESQLCAFLGN